MMHKNRIVLVPVFVILILVSPIFIFAQNEENSETGVKSLASEELSEGELTKAMNLDEPSSDGIYKIGNFSIKYIPPKGWKMLKRPSSSGYACIQFKRPDFSMTSLSISIVSFPAVSNMGSTVFLENMLKELTSRDQNVSEQHLIKFADTDAATWITKLGGIKTKQIQFFKGIDMFIITFGAEDQNFDNLIPIIEESLNVFKIISSDPK